MQQAASPRHTARLSATPGGRSAGPPPGPVSQGNAPGGRSIGPLPGLVPSTENAPGGRSAGPLPGPALRTGMALTVIKYLLQVSCLGRCKELVLRGGHPHNLGRYTELALTKRAPRLVSSWISQGSSEAQKHCPCR